MAKRKIVGQSGRQNRSGSSRDAWTRKKTMMKTLTGQKKNQSEFRGNKTIKGLLNTLKKQGGRGSQAFLHNGFSQGNLGGLVISNVKGNKGSKKVQLIFGQHGDGKNGGATVYDIGLRDKRDIKGYLTAVKALFHDKEYLKLMKETGNTQHGAMTLANRILGLEEGKTAGTIIGKDFVTATTYNNKGIITNIKHGTRTSGGNRGGGSTNTNNGNGGGGSTGPTFNQPIVTNLGETNGKPKMTKEQFKNVEAMNLTAEQWGQMSKSQKFLTIAKMSSPAFKADKANEFAKKMETKAKNISRGIGIAGKAIGGVGRGLSSGYNKGWGSR